MSLGFGLRNLSRVREILSVLIFDYGLGYAFDNLGISRVLPIGRRRPRATQYDGVPGPRRLRMALVELGPTFIKLGQMLGARGDLLPPPVVSEMRRLQDEGPTVPFDQVRGLIERELGRPLEQCFASVDPTPLSSASLGQVHAATLFGGSEVTVKVLRPGVRQTVEADLQILSDLATLLHRQVASLRRYNMPAFVRQFAAQLEDEMVYTFEAHNAGRLRRCMAEAGYRIRVPEVIWELTTREVLTTQRLWGHRVDELPEAIPEVDRAEVAREIGRAMLHQVFVEGFFHGDPHQGNVWIADDGWVVLLDFGIVGYLDPRMRRLLGQTVGRVLDQDVDGLVSVLGEIGSTGPDTDLAALRTELARMVSRFLLLPRRDFPIGEMLTRAVRALWLNNVRVPPQLSLVAKAMLVAEGVSTELDPSSDYRELAEPMMEQVRARELAPSAVADRALRALEMTARRIGRLPERLDRALALVQHGALRLQVDEPEAEARWGRLTRGLNRVGLSVLTLALLVAAALFLVLGEGTWHSVLGVLALIGALGLGMVVVIALLRPGQL